MKRLSILFGLLAICISLWATPAYNGLITYTQPDGSTVACYIVGDEFSHAYLSVDGILMQSDEAGAMRYAKIDASGAFTLFAIAHNVDERTADEESLLASFSHEGSAVLQQVSSSRRKAGPHRATLNIGEHGRTNYKTIGPSKGIVLLVEFSNRSFTEGYDNTLFNDLVNGDNFNYDGATGSIRQYFMDQSYGQFQPEFDVVGPVKMSNTLAYYGNNDSNGSDQYAYEMIIEACKAADKDFDIDFSQYDNDGDGIVDFVYAIYAGYGESYGAGEKYIWPHMSSLVSRGQNVELDGVKLDHYACSCELKYTSGTTLEGIGSFTHEFGHVLGLPDFYQTNSGSDVAIGYYDVMDRGCYNNGSHTPPGYSGFERYCMHWLEFNDLSERKADIQVPWIGEEPVAYRLQSTYNDDEYFVLENRQPSGWDAHLPASGMMITHIDYLESAWQSNVVNNTSSHFRYSIVPADNDISTSNFEGDLWPGLNQTAFTDTSIPAATLFTGGSLHKPVTNIRNTGGMVLFSLMQQKLDTPHIQEPTDVTENSFTANWDAVYDVMDYGIYLRKVLDEKDANVVLDEDFVLMDMGDYPQNSGREISGDLDDYTWTSGWMGSKLYDAGGYCQVGEYGINGTITTPVLNLAGNGGTFTVAVKGKAAVSRTVNCKVLVNDKLTDVQVATQKFKATAQDATYLCTFTVGTEATTVTIQTNGERFFINDMRILPGEVAEEDVWTVGAQPVYVSGHTDNSIHFTDLVDGGTYEYFVQAFSSDHTFDSYTSPIARVTLVGGESGINNAHSGESRIYDYYTPMGIRIFRGTTEQFRRINYKGLVKRSLR